MKKRILTILLLASVLFITFAITNSVKAATDLGPQFATVTSISGSADIAGSGTEKVTIKYNELDLKYFEADTSVGRDSAGWWIGMKIVAPNGMTEDQLKEVKFQRWGEERMFWNVKDSKAAPHYFEAWFRVDKQVLKNTKEDVSIIDYTFDWNNDGTAEQTISVFVVPDKIKLDNKDVISITVGDRVFTIREGKTLKDLAEYDYELLQKQTVPAEGKKFVGFFTEDGKQVKEDDAITADMELIPRFENIEETPDEDEPTKDEPSKEEQTKDEQTKDEQTKEEQKKEEQTKEKDDTPKTGITDVIGYVAIVTVVSAIGIVVLNKRH